MATDFVTTTTAATSALYEAAQETYLALLGAALDSQERSVRLTRVWIDESRRSGKSAKTLFETLDRSWRAAGEAVQEFASTPVSVAGWEMPAAPLGWPVRGPESNGVPTPPPVVPQPPTAPRSRPPAPESPSGPPFRRPAGAPGAGPCPIRPRLRPPPHPRPSHVALATP